MFHSKYFNYILIIIGCTVAVYAKAGTQQNVSILILGIVILMFGIYRISATIPSKFDKDDQDENNADEDF